jgi:hexosaminidase
MFKKSRPLFVLVIAVTALCKTIISQSGSKAFPFRSMHLDVARHFFPPEVIKQYIDSLSAHNYNYFHWHLTDDQGWRIEIKAFPLLTKTGAWRKEKNNAIYGGYYTQEQLKEIVEYAAKKNIEIIPEIDFPGHCSSAIAAYPWLSCSGDLIAVPSKRGIYKSVLCPSDTTIKFLKIVFDEVCTIFPGKYIHIGGDEVLKSTWRKDSSVARLMKKNKLTSLRALQNYWMQEMAIYLMNKGKSVIVWGEVTRAPFSKDLIIMSWRGKQAGIKAAKNGNQVIMASRFYCYFDYPKSRKDKKPFFIYPYLTNEKVKTYHLYSKRLTTEENKNIIGGAGMLWTEFVTDTTQLWYQFSPRVGTLGKVLSSGYRH